MAYSREVEMRKVIVDEWMSLDGVVQAPGHAQEDTDGGFAHGGWHMPYFDELSQDWVVEGYVDPGGFLLGRRTYEILGAFLAHRSGKFVQRSSHSRTSGSSCSVGREPRG
jgi:dihydrofolate reductase